MARSFFRGVSWKPCPPVFSVNSAVEQLSRHDDLGTRDHLTFHLAGHHDRMAGVRLEILQVLVRDLKHLAVHDERELRASANARERAIPIGHLALAFSSFLVLRTAEVVA